MVILERSFQFSLRILDLYKNLLKEKEFIISKQLLRSGTSIGANVHEASAAFSRKDFIYKMSIASKEARETQYWIKLLEEGDFVKTDLSFYSVEISNIVNITTAIVKSAQRNQK